MKMTQILATGLIAMGSAAHSQVVAPADVERTTRTVQYGDLDLGSKHGRKKLEGCIRAAARNVCDEGDQACYSLALTDGLRQMNQVLALNGPQSTDASVSPPSTGR